MLPFALGDHCAHQERAVVRVTDDGHVGAQEERAVDSDVARESREVPARQARVVHEPPEVTGPAESPAHVRPVRRLGHYRFGQGAVLRSRGQGAGPGRHTGEYGRKDGRGRYTAPGRGESGAGVLLSLVSHVICLLARWKHRRPRGPLIGTATSRQVG
jgi:hypothetical protein